MIEIEEGDHPLYVGEGEEKLEVGRVQVRNVNGEAVINITSVARDFAKWFV